jgi:hypothetical protein
MLCVHDAMLMLRAVVRACVLMPCDAMRCGAMLLMRAMPMRAVKTMRACSTLLMLCGAMRC